MGVLERAKSLSGYGSSSDDAAYACRACEAEFDLQYYRCPNCDSYDIRNSNWDMDTDTR